MRASWLFEDAIAGFRDSGFVLGDLKSDRSWSLLSFFEILLLVDHGDPDSLLSFVAIFFFNGPL